MVVARPTGNDERIEKSKFGCRGLVVEALKPRGREGRGMVPYTTVPALPRGSFYLMGETEL